MAFVIATAIATFIAGFSIAMAMAMAMAIAACMAMLGSAIIYAIARPGGINVGLVGRFASRAELNKY
jgi:hypothetical protein